MSDTAFLRRAADAMDKVAEYLETQDAAAQAHRVEAHTERVNELRTKVASLDGVSDDTLSRIVEDQQLVDIVTKLASSETPEDMGAGYDPDDNNTAGPMKKTASRKRAMDDADARFLSWVNSD